MKRSKATAARERKRLEQEQKKKETEEEQQKKKALAAERKALADEKKALVATKKTEKEAGKSRRASNFVSDSSNRKQQSSDNQTAVKKSLRLTEAAATKGSSSPRIASSDGQNECCVCFEMYRGEDEVNDRLQCVCSRCLHEECITDIVHGKFGRELFCPYCLL